LAYAVAGLLLVASIISVVNSSRTGRSEPLPPISDDQRSAGQAAIRLAGYRCDTIDDMGRLVFKTGYRVNCNSYRYAYEIVDEGGRWVVRLD
jgi:hypothetical protein